MNMKSIVSAVTAIALCLLLTDSYAQGGPGGMRGNRSELMINMLRDSLDLSKEQVEKVTVIVTGTFESLAKAREEAQGDRQLIAEKMQELYKGMDEQIEKELNDAQKARYQAMRAEREKRRQERMQQMRQMQQGGQ